MSGGSIRHWDIRHQQQYISVRTYGSLSSLLLFICLDEILLANSPVMDVSTRCPARVRQKARGVCALVAARPTMLRRAAN
jgi:hypothetical protein